MIASFIMCLLIQLRFSHPSFLPRELCALLSLSLLPVFPPLVSCPLSSLALFCFLRFLSSVSYFLILSVLVFFFICCFPFVSSFVLFSFSLFFFFFCSPSLFLVIAVHLFLPLARLSLFLVLSVHLFFFLSHFLFFFFSFSLRCPFPSLVVVFLFLVPAARLFTFCYDVCPRFIFYRCGIFFTLLFIYLFFFFLSERFLLSPPAGRYRYRLFD